LKGFAVIKMPKITADKARLKAAQNIPEQHFAS